VSPFRWRSEHSSRPHVEHPSATARYSASQALGSAKRSRTARAVEKDSVLLQPGGVSPSENTVHPVSASGAVWLERVLPKLKKLRTVSTVAHGIPGPTNEPADQKAQEISPLTVIQHPPLRSKTLPGPVRSESAK
jgi:hypothetical protein